MSELPEHSASDLIAVEVTPTSEERSELVVRFNRGMSVGEMNSFHRRLLGIGAPHEPKGRLLQDRADDLIREIARQGMETMRIEFLGKVLTVSPARPVLPPEPESQFLHFYDELTRLGRLCKVCGGKGFGGDGEDCVSCLATGIAPLEKRSAEDEIGDADLDDGC